MWITSWTPTIFFYIILKFKVTIYIFSKIFGKVLHSWKKKTSLASTMYGAIDTLWLIEAIVSILMKVLRWSRTISYLFLRICCIVDDIVHFIWMRGCINNYPHPVCGIHRYQFKKKHISKWSPCFQCTLSHPSTSFFFQSQNSYYKFPHISPSRSLCPWPTFCPSWEYYCAGFECRTSSFAKSINQNQSMSHRVSTVPYIVGAKEVFIFLTMKYFSENFQKNIYCHFEFEHDIWDL